MLCRMLFPGQTGCRPSFAFIKIIKDIGRYDLRLSFGMLFLAVMVIFECFHFVGR